MSWFEALTGFDEAAVEDVAAQFMVDGDWIDVPSTGRRFRAGRFATPSLGELRTRTDHRTSSGPVTVVERVGDAGALHRVELNAGALFQVASQFNTLEMISPNVSPGDGVSRYAYDRTQGPICAISCGAGTIARNYLVDVDGSPGQSADRQINCLAELADGLGVDVPVRNGYALPTEEQLRRITETLAAANAERLDGLRALLRIGMQWETEVTTSPTHHLVTQAYCSAVPVGYSPHSPELWEPFARLVLEASYEATLRAAMLNADATGNRSVFLTLVGGGVFGNRMEWIVDAIERATDIVGGAGLDVAIVSYGQPNPAVARLLR